MRQSRWQRKATAHRFPRWNHVLNSAAVGASIAACLAFPLAASAQDVGKDVPPTHWAYQAVEDLASKGLIKGYPPDGKFLGGRTLTRYEAATILQRVLARVDDLVKANAPGNPAPSGVSKEDLDNLKSSQDEIRKLVDEFKVQLTVIGTDLDQAKKDLDEIKTQLGALSTRVDAVEKKTGENSTAIDQALENLDLLRSSTTAALAKKVDVTTGKLRVSGLLQAWYGTAFGDALSGNNPSSLSAAPPVGIYGNGVGDTFRLRRGELAFIGSIDSRVDYRAMFDIAKTSNTTASGAVLQDLWVGYNLAPRWRLEVGQQKTGLSEEGTRSSSQLLTVERAVFNTLLTNAGRVGDIRDTGAVMRYQGTSANAFVGIWNDNGVTQNSTDTDHGKFFDFAAYLTAIRHVTLGAWGGTTVGDTTNAFGRDRLGGTAIWQGGPHFFEVEGAYARDLTTTGTGTISRGFYALYAHTISRKWQLVGRFDNWDPAVQEGRTGASVTTTTGVAVPRAQHQLRQYTLGFNYYIKGNNAKIQLNYIRVSPETNAVSLFGKQRDILLANYQISF